MKSNNFKTLLQNELIDIVRVPEVFNVVYVSLHGEFDDERCTIHRGHY